MVIALGSVTVQMHITTSTKLGGPVILGEADIEIPVSTESTPNGARITIAQDTLRHEIAAALIDTAHQIENPDEG